MKFRTSCSLADSNWDNCNMVIVLKASLTIALEIRHNGVVVNM